MAFSLLSCSVRVYPSSRLNIIFMPRWAKFRVLSMLAKPRSRIIGGSTRKTADEMKAAMFRMLQSIRMRVPLNPLSDMRNPRASPIMAPSSVRSSYEAKLFLHSSRECHSAISTFLGASWATWKTATNAYSAMSSGMLVVAEKA